MTRKKRINTDQTSQLIREHLFSRAIRGLFLSTQGRLRLTLGKAFFILSRAGARALI
jgi:hypothetical protein